MDINVKNHLGYTPLHSAVTQCHLDVAELLIKRGADLAITSNDGWSCLHTACQLGYLEVVELLISYGADMNYRNILGLGSIHLAVSRGHLHIVSFLVEKGVDLDQQPESYSPLHVAALVGRIECFTYLIEKGLDVNLQNGQGNTPLHLACFEGELGIVKLLIEYGADMTLLNNDDESVIQVSKPPLDLYVIECHSRQVERDESCILLYKYALYLTNTVFPIEIKYHILGMASKGLTHKEWLRISKVLLNPHLISSIKPFKLAHDFIRQFSC
jgi:ankyrin repeat protein